MTGKAGSSYEFEGFRIDPTKRLLLRGDRVVPLPPKAFDVLLLLVRERHRPVRKDELMRAIWPDTFVEEGNLAQNIFVLRRSLGESPHDHRFIVTLPGQGYRFVADIHPVGPSPAAPRMEIESVAVLPFRTLGSDGSDEYLGIGMADALAVRLRGVRSLKLRPLGSLRQRRGGRRDPVRAGRELNADAVIYGTIQRSEGAFRVTIQILNVSDGSLVWAETFQGAMSGIFAVQDRISESVAAALTSTLSGEEKRQLTRRQTDSAEAYHAYLKGRYFWNKRTAEGYRKSIRFFELASAADPGYAPAQAGLADCYNLLACYGIVRPCEAWERARAAACEALRNDPDSAEAHAALALVHMGQDWDPAAAANECRRALELNPRYAMAHDYYAEYLMAAGRMEEAIAALNRARELDPLSLIVNRDLGCALYYARRYEEAAGQLRDTLDLDPGFTVARASLGRALERLGRHDHAIAEFETALAGGEDNPRVLADLGHAYGTADRSSEARSVLERLDSLSRERYLPPFAAALVWCGMGERDRALTGLEQAAEDRQWDLVYLLVEPQLDPLRDDPRFSALLARTGLKRD